MKPKTLMAGGAAVAGLTAIWWDSEVAGRVGVVQVDGFMSCLMNFGTGSCGKLWFIGLHQENQVASLIFWVAIGAAVYGLWRYAQERPSRRRWPN
jgi:hypothetical protein